MRINLMLPTLDFSSTHHLPLRFRRRLKSVYNVIEGIRANGFSDTGTTALWVRWCAVVRMGPTGSYNLL